VSPLATATGRLRAGGLAAAACAGVAACGSAAAPAPTTRPRATRPPAVVAVTMRNIRFMPRRVVVRLGQTVRWTNDDDTAHTVASQSLRIASEAIRPGQTFTYRPRRRGSFFYFCTIHAGQTGRIVVR
jgi:plastocyanin